MAAIEQIKPGELAPRFKGISFDGRWIDLDQFRGKKVWLIFYRYEGCPICTRHTVELLKRQTELKNAGLEIVAVYQSQPAQARSLVCKEARAAFPCIADPEKKIYKLYGVGEGWLAVLRPSVGMSWLKSRLGGHEQSVVEGSFTQKTAHFLIREDGVVSKAHYGSTIADQIGFEEVIKFAGSARVAAALPAHASGQSQGWVPASSASVGQFTGSVKLDKQALPKELIIERSFGTSSTNESATAYPQDRPADPGFAEAPNRSSSSKASGPDDSSESADSADSAESEDGLLPYEKSKTGS